MSVQSDLLKTYERHSLTFLCTIVNKEEGLFRKPGKHQKSKQTCRDLGWKVHNRAKYFVLRSYTTHELRNQHVSIG